MAFYAILAIVNYVLFLFYIVYVLNANDGDRIIPALLGAFHAGLFIWCMAQI